MEINLVRDKLTLLLFARFLIYERMCARIVVNGYPPLEVLMLPHTTSWIIMVTTLFRPKLHLGITVVLH